MKSFCNKKIKLIYKIKKNKKVFEFFYFFDLFYIINFKKKK